MGRFGEVGHPYTHPTEKQCNYSVDTSLFATKEYVDTKVGPIAGAVGVSMTLDSIISAATTASGNYLTVTTTYDLSDIGFDVYKILVTDSIEIIQLPRVGIIYGSNHPHSSTYMYGFGSERELITATSIETSVYEYTLWGNCSMWNKRQISLQNNILTFSFITQNKTLTTPVVLEESFTWPALTLKCFA